MIRVYDIGDRLVITKKNDAGVREHFGRKFELIEIINDERHAETLIDRLVTRYKKPAIIDGKIKKFLKIGWKHMTDSQRDRCRAAIKQYRTGRKWSADIIEKISKARKGVGNFNGKRHTVESRIATSIAMTGNDNAKGLRWMHDPYTGKETRAVNLVPGMRWGRSPENVQFRR